jgi:hypothetical protein
MYLSFPSRAPLPDIICRGTDDLLLRTRFHRTGNTIEHEVLIEPPE